MWNGTDEGEEGVSAKRMKIGDDQEKQPEVPKEDERCLPDLSAHFDDKKWVEFFGVVGRFFRNITKDDSQKKSDTENIPSEQPETQVAPSTMTDFWNFGNACRTWNQAVGELHWNEDAGNLFVMEESFAKNYDLVSKRRDIIFKDEAKLDKFMNHFEGTHFDSVAGKLQKCPFMGRSVEIFFDNVTVQSDQLEKFQTYFNKVLLMLGKYGEEVWYFKLICSSEGSDVGYVYWYRKLKEIVKLMPNLKALVVKFHFISEEEEFNWDQEIGINPFPNLPTLELITVFQMPGPLSNHLINQNRQISVLNVRSGILGDAVGNCEIFTDNLPNLSRLIFEINSMEDFEKFKNYQHTLNLVEFGIMFSASMPFLPWSLLFKVIESKLVPESCKFLALQFPAPRTEDDQLLVVEESVTCSLKLTKVGFLWSFNKNARYGLDFLLPSKKSLERIEVRCDTDIGNEDHEEYYADQIIEFLGFEHDFTDSNICEHFPRLKYLAVNPRQDICYNKRSDQ